MATSYDYAPLFRSSVGFDRVFNLLENAQARPLDQRLAAAMTSSRPVMIATGSLSLWQASRSTISTSPFSPTF